jgi:type VI secretion system protein ImpK
LLDAATPLFGLVIRARRMADHDQIPQLYVRVRNEITVVLEEIKQAGFAAPEFCFPGLQRRYCLELCLQ